MVENILDESLTDSMRKRKSGGRTAGKIELGEERMRERLMETQGDTVNTKVRSNQD